MKRAAGVSGQYGQQAALELERGKAQGNMWSNVGQGVSQAAGAYGAQQNQNALMDKYLESQKRGTGAVSTTMYDEDDWMKQYGGSRGRNA